jgi:hypothetical protein
VVSAAAVAENDWGLALTGDGTFLLNQMNDLFVRGTLTADQPEVEVLDFTCFEMPKSTQN